MKAFLLGLMMLVSLSVCAQHAFTLSGKIVNGAQTWLYLSEDKTVTDRMYNDSTLTDAFGNFSFSGTLKEPRLFNMRIKGRNNVAASVKFFVTSAAMLLNGTADSLYKAKITGSDEQTLFEGFALMYNKELTDFTKVVYKNYNAAKERNDSVVMLREAAIADMRVINKASDMVTDFVKKYPSRAFSLELVDMLIKYSRLNTADSLMQLIEQTPAGKYALALKLRTTLDTQRHLAIGATAPDFSQPDTAGRQVSLSSFRGKYVFVDFWASWCKPCRAENPHVLKAYQKYKDANFTVLAVSLDKDRKSWMRAIHEDKLPWRQLSDLKGFDNDAGKLYAVTAIPVNYLLDPNGKIIATNLRGEALEQNLEKLLKSGGRE